MDFTNFLASSNSLGVIGEPRGKWAKSKESIVKKVPKIIVLTLIREPKATSDGRGSSDRIR